MRPNSAAWFRGELNTRTTASDGNDVQPADECHVFHLSSASEPSRRDDHILPSSSVLLFVTMRRLGCLNAWLCEERRDENRVFLSHLLGRGQLAKIILYISASIFETLEWTPGAFRLCSIFQRRLQYRSCHFTSYLIYTHPPISSVAQYEANTGAARKCMQTVLFRKALM